MALILIFLGIVALIVFVFLKSGGRYVNATPHHKKPEANSEIIKGISLDQKDINGFGTHYLEEN